MPKPTCHCGKHASFNVRDGKALFCAKHKAPGMVNVISKKCKSCDKIPSYNFRGETKGLFCAEHKTSDMVDVVHKTCKSCNKIPVYNFRGETKGLFCADHKAPGMVDVKNITCEMCNKQPMYNISGETKGRFCAKHKEPGMVDVKNSTCKSCDKLPVYNFRGETKGLFCAEHKAPDMVDVKNITCKLCDIRPSFNIRGETKGLFCAEHKESGMINVVDILCELCDIRAWYGRLGKGNNRCAVHKQTGMIRYPNRKCSSCKQLGTHEANGARFCEEHKPADAENLGIATCSMCGLDDILTNGKCGTCDPHVIQVRRHAKENRIKDFLIASRITLVHDKMLEGTMCGRERPDFQIDCGTHYVYIEVDEHQHDTYACECEQTRMVNLVEVRGMPVRWIRYNPDTYESQKGQRQVKIEQREKKLLEYVKWAMQHSPQEDGDISSVLYLFYDEYDTTKQPWMKLI